MKIKYSPDFAERFRDLPAQTQEKFRGIDRKVASGDFRDFDTMGWAHFVDIDTDWSAMGRIKEEGQVFYWILLGSPESMPVIL